jgi:hypothetical protein
MAWINATPQIKIDSNQDKGQLTLNNGIFERVLKTDVANNAFYSSSYTDLGTGIIHLDEGSYEFAFKIIGKQIMGTHLEKYSITSHTVLLKVKTIAKF